MPLNSNTNNNYRFTVSRYLYLYLLANTNKIITIEQAVSDQINREKKIINDLKRNKPKHLSVLIAYSTAYLCISNITTATRIHVSQTQFQKCCFCSYQTTANAIHCVINYTEILSTEFNAVEVWPSRTSQNEYYLLPIHRV